VSTDYLKDAQSPFKSEAAIRDADRPVQSGQESLTYEPFFGLNEKPFSLESDPRFIYDSPAHDVVRKSLVAGIRRREGLLVLTGEIGTGKTTLCRTVLRDLGSGTYSSLVLDPFAAREDLLKMLLIDFGVMSIHDLTASRFQRISRTELGYLLTEFLDTLHRDAYAVVIIDEAQHLALPLIEETRILFDTFGAKGRLQIVYVGQPELHHKLKLPEMRQVDQRICGYHRLAPMNRDSVAGYIQHRLRVAGAPPDRHLFPPAVIDVVHQRTGGVARLINRVCDRALQLAYENDRHCVDQEILDAALIEVGSITLLPTWDSIVFGEPDAASIGAGQRPKSRPAASVPQSDDAREFKAQLDEWVAIDSASAASDAVRVDAVEVKAPVEITPAFDVKPAIDLNPTTDLKAPVEQKPAIDHKAATDHKPAIEHKAAVEPKAAVERKQAAETKPAADVKPRAIAGDAAPARHPAPHHARTPSIFDVAPEIPSTPAWQVWGVRASLAAAALAAIYTLTWLVPLIVSARTAPALPPPPAAPERVLAGIEVPHIPSVDAASAATRHVVVVGQFAREAAEELVDTLQDAGLPVSQRRIRQTEMRQILLGPYVTRGGAIIALRRLQSLGGFPDAAVFDSTDESFSQ
jgi:type II secretory pathway predicted ATPase ExeA